MEVLSLPIIGAIVVVVLLLVVGVVALRRKELPPPDRAETLPPPSVVEPEEAPLPPESAPAVKPESSDEGDVAAAIPHPPEAPPEPAPEPTEGLFARLKKGLSRTQQQLAARIDDVFKGRKAIDEELLEELEMALIAADMGVRTAATLLDDIREASERSELADATALRARLRESIVEILGRHDHRIHEVESSPQVIMVVGVNGAGKTTTIGKLATRYARAGKRVLLAAGDTFRAAAIEQLEVWGDRANVPVVRREEGSDPSSVVFDALKRAQDEGYDLVIADTAGRLHTKVNLMDELKKIHRVIGKVVPGAPHETLLVLDATTGQNAVLQARSFNEGVSLTGLVLTKLDGTAKGGIVVQVINELGIPVKLIGVGEGVDDLRDFEPGPFVDALL